MTATPRFCVLMATYNGQSFIDEQIKSIAEQSVGEIDIFISDDGSTDATLEHVAAWVSRWARGRIDVCNGPGLGFAENFRSLIRDAPEGYDFYAFCDQDDIWHHDKFETAVDQLMVHTEKPALYCGRTMAIDENGVELGLSPLMVRGPSFENALVQSIAGGNTMVFNAALGRLLKQSIVAPCFVAHDWWTYQLCMGCDGVVVYDCVPKVGYRQHQGNLIGSYAGLKAKLDRLRRMKNGTFSGWLKTQFTALAHVRDLLGNRQQTMLIDINGLIDINSSIDKRNSQLFNVFWRNNIHRQRISDTVILYGMAFFGRI